MLEEITVGLDLLSIDDPDGAVEWLTRSPTERQARLEANDRIARDRFAVEHLPDRIRDAFTAVGWTDW